MKILLMRHGESMAQAKLLNPDETDYMAVLTEKGIEQVKSAANKFDGKIDVVYSSPYKRTVITANTFINTHDKDLSINIDERLREIDFGIHSDNKSHPEMIDVANRQMAGDYEVRFGRTGENKREIVTRVFNFMIDVFFNNKKDDVILAVSHGRVISIIDYEFGTINNIKKEHISTTNASIKEIELTIQSIEKIKEFLNRF